MPLNEQHGIEDDSRIKATRATIQKILKEGGAAILMAHLGRPKGEYGEELSLKHIVPYLEEHLRDISMASPALMVCEVF